MDIKVLGPGCPRCEQTRKNVDDAVAESGVDANIEKVTDIMEIAKFGILATPGVVVDGEVRCAGKVPKKDEILKWIKG
ncbi:MAG: thioredoxin family protein [Deltaproteobacteria bacterium]|jgi:small redox-active disulfide protein 2